MNSVDALLASDDSDESVNDILSSSGNKFGKVDSTSEDGSFVRSISSEKSLKKSLPSRRPIAPVPPIKSTQNEALSRVSNRPDLVVGPPVSGVDLEAKQSAVEQSNRIMSDEDALRLLAESTDSIDKQRFFSGVFRIILVSV